MFGHASASDTPLQLERSRPPFLAPLLNRRSPLARIVACILLSIVALIPFGVVLAHATAESRNIVYWDEIDTVLDLLLKLDDGLDIAGFFDRIFAINNEHRMLTSRLMFVASWWLTGTVDFQVIGAIGNLFLVGLCVALVWAAGRTERRVRLGIALAFLLFQLEHYENLLWSGASIDHFQVVALAVGAIVALTRPRRLAFAAACGLAVLATFTLAHGLVTWAVGALMLWRDRRWRSLAVWVTIAALAGLSFFHGFEINSGHRVVSFDFTGLLHLARYWLALLGAPLALGFLPVAPFAGVVLLAAIAWLAWRRAWQRDIVAQSTMLFCVGALVLVAIGRSQVDGGVLHSRYMVLAALAWALVIFVALERFTHPKHPYRLLVAALPFLAAFNITANLRFGPVAESFLEHRDRAALRFKQHGRDGTTPFRLYPEPNRASKIINDAAQRGLYFIPRMCVRVDVPNAVPSGRIAYFIDEMTVDTRSTYIAGWAAIPEEISKRGQIHLVFRSATSTIVYTTVGMSRPDVAMATSNPDWRLSGFRFAVGRWRLPPEELQLGLMIVDDDRAEFIMTEHRLRPYGRGEALLAKGE